MMPAAAALPHAAPAASVEILEDSECHRLVRDGGVMWLAALEGEDLTEFPATFSPTARGLLARPAPAHRVPPGVVAFAVTGEDDRGTWRVVGLCRAAPIPGPAGSTLVRLVPTRVLGARRISPL